MKILLAILCGLTIQISVYAKYYKAKIIMVNGSELNGLAELPMDPVGPPIWFKENKHGKRQLIACDSIKSVIYYSEKGHIWEYDRMHANLNEAGPRPAQLWLEVSRRGPVTLYKYSHQNWFSRSNTSANRFYRHWICMRSGETALGVSCQLWKKKAFKEIAVDYFKDDAELTKKIEDEQYTWDDMVAIVDEYNNWKKDHP